jgi:protein TonB
MGSLARLFVGVPVAAVVTAVLFLFMAYMIRQQAKLQEEQEAIKIDVTAQIQETDLSRTKQFKRPVLDTPPPPPPAVHDPSNRPAIGGVRAAIPTLDVNLRLGSGFNPDRDAQPLVRIPAIYPDRCKERARDREHVQVEFDVAPDGTTTNIKVVDSTNTCLNSAAVRSVEKWKYQPKIVDGQAQWRRGVATTVTFELLPE